MRAFADVFLQRDFSTLFVNGRAAVPHDESKRPRLSISLSFFEFDDDVIVEFAVRRSWVKARRCTASPSSAKRGLRIDASDATSGSNELKMKQM